MIDLDEQKRAWKLRDLQLYSYSQFAPTFSASPLVVSSLLGNSEAYAPEERHRPWWCRSSGTLVQRLADGGWQHRLPGIHPRIQIKLLPAEPQGTCGTLPPSAVAAMPTPTSTTATSTSTSTGRCSTIPGSWEEEAGGWEAEARKLQGTTAPATLRSCNATGCTRCEPCLDGPVLGAESMQTPDTDSRGRAVNYVSE